MFSYYFLVTIIYSTHVFADLISIDKNIVHYNNDILTYLNNNNINLNNKKNYKSKRRVLKPKISKSLSNLQHCYDSGEAYSASYLIHKGYYYCYYYYYYH